MRLLIWIGLIALVITAFRSQMRNTLKRTNTPPEETTAEPMVACAHCGVHFPASEAVSGAGVVFCSEEHRQLFLHN